MRVTALMAGLFLCVLVFLTSDAKANAQTQQALVLDASNVSQSSTGTIAVLDLVVADKQVEDVPPAPTPKPAQTHTVAAGDSLTKIAATYQTTWQRLYAKNTDLADPNVITSGYVLTIPTADEVLPERTVPVAPVVTTSQPVSSAKPATTAHRGAVAGNSYTYGYCTWYVKNRRPDMPNNLGNANTWVARAAAQGMATGSAPRTGAVGQQGMHVVYVEAVNGDGTVTISEMNHLGFGVINSRTVPASYFSYIY